jgi:hypothetical protein
MYKSKYPTLINFLTNQENLIDKDLKAINYTPCCKSLNLEVKPTFKEWLNVNFTKYDKEYYQDNGRNGIWKKHQLYELYENTTL